MPITWNDRRFTFVQLLLGCAIVGAGAAALAWSGAKLAPRPIEVHPESQALKDKYGPHRNSYSEEEWCIRDFFSDKRGGYFVDVGANDYKVTSNTYYLDTVLNWTGLAVEPQREFEADYVRVPAADEIPVVLRVRSVEPAREDVCPQEELAADIGEQGIYGAAWREGQGG